MKTTNVSDIRPIESDRKPERSEDDRKLDDASYRQGLAVSTTEVGLSSLLTRRVLLWLCKGLVGLMFLSLFFFPLNSLWFTFALSTIMGLGYYIMVETRPQLTMFFLMLLKYQTESILAKAKKWFTLNPFGGKKVNIQHNMCIVQHTTQTDKFNSLVYYDNKMVGNKLKQHIFLFNEKLRSNDLIIFKDELDQDITDFIEPYLGPVQNFHGVPLTPGDFNLKKIKVFRDGTINLSKTFEETEPIVF